MTDTTKTLAALLIAGFVATPLMASQAATTLQPGTHLGTSESEIRTALAQQGYSIEEFELEDDEIEVETMIDGKEYEIEIDPQSGLILSIEEDD